MSTQILHTCDGCGATVPDGVGVVQGFVGMADGTQDRLPVQYTREWHACSLAHAADAAAKTADTLRGEFEARYAATQNNV